MEQSPIHRYPIRKLLWNLRKKVVNIDLRRAFLVGIYELLRESLLERKYFVISRILSDVDILFKDDLNFV